MTGNVLGTALEAGLKVSEKLQGVSFASTQAVRLFSRAFLDVADEALLSIPGVDHLPQIYQALTMAPVAVLESALEDQKDNKKRTSLQHAGAAAIEAAAAQSISARVKNMSAMFSGALTEQEQAEKQKAALVNPTAAGELLTEDMKQVLSESQKIFAQFASGLVAGIAPALLASIRANKGKVPTNNKASTSLFAPAPKPNHGKHKEEQAGIELVELPKAPGAASAA